MKKYQDQVRQHRELARQLDSEKTESGFNSSMSNFSKKFTISLKGGKKLKVKLVRPSKNHDLALLEPDKFQTPYLRLPGVGKPSHGTKVYAIGSPPGISDSLTTGIITKADEEHLITGTRILPGKSGGPLIDDGSQVLGVNTATVSAGKYSDTLGPAVYANFIRREFARELGGKI